MSGLQGRDYIREVQRPLDEVGDVGRMPGGAAPDQSVGVAVLNQWIATADAKQKRIDELEKELASINAVKIKEMRVAVQRAEKRAEELHIANLTRPEVDLIVRNVMAIMMAIANLPDPPIDPKKDDRRRQIIVGVQQLGQEVLAFCGSGSPFPAAREAYQIALRAFYGQVSERDMEFMTKFGLLYNE